jgi:hypothetical protein
VNELIPINAEIARRESDDWMPVFSIDNAIQRRNAIVQFVKQIMVPDTDYGVIPGTKKQVLLKPGAERLCSFFGFSPEFVTIEEVNDWTGERHNGEPFFYVKYKCRLTRNGKVIGDGEGSCNSWENKYRYRTTERVCPSCEKPTIIKGREEYGGGWVCFKKKGGCGTKFPDGDTSIESQQVGKTPNPDVADTVNTIQKMGQKRALIAAVLIGVNASEFFTQDLEDEVRGSQAAANDVAEEKLAAMKAGAQYEDVSSRDERRDPPKPTIVPPPDPKPPFNMCKSISEFQKLHQFACESLGKEKGDAIYYKVLGNFGAEHSNEIKSAKPARECYRTMASAIDAEISYKKGSDAFDAFVTSSKVETGA